jgi:hypothetical protein
MYHTLFYSSLLLTTHLFISRPIVRYHIKVWEPALLKWYAHFAILIFYVAFFVTVYHFIIFGKLFLFFLCDIGFASSLSKFVKTNQAQTQLCIFQTWWRHRFALFVLDRCHVGDGCHPDLDPGPPQRDHRPLRQARKLLEVQSSQELQTI